MSATSAMPPHAPLYHRRDWIAGGVTLALALIASFGPGLMAFTPPTPKPPEIKTEIELAPPEPEPPKAKPQPQTQPQPQPQPKPEPKPEPKPQPRPEPKPEPKPLPKPTPAPQPTPAPTPTPTADATPATTSAPATRAAQTAPSAPAPTAKAEPAPPPPQKGNPDRDYERKVRSLVEARKRYPTSRQASIEKPVGAVGVCVTIDRSGAVRDVNVNNSSGSLLLDTTASRLVEGTTYPPFDESHFKGQSTHAFCMKLEYQLPGS